MATTTSRTRTKRVGFINRTQGYLGAVKINRKGDPEGVTVEPGARVFLTDEEIELTEQAHARAENSPFVPREIVHRDPATGDETDRFAAAPLERVVSANARRRKVPAVA